MFFTTIYYKQICALVKRGIKDTNDKGGNGEVQVYFEGAVSILQQVDTIDPVLLFCGRITLDDMKLSRVLRVVRRDGVLLPEFARNTNSYRKKLRQIAISNGINKVKEKETPESEPSPIVSSRPKRYISVGPTFAHRKKTKSIFFGLPIEKKKSRQTKTSQSTKNTKSTKNAKSTKSAKNTKSAKTAKSAKNTKSIVDKGTKAEKEILTLPLINISQQSKLKELLPI